MGRDLNMLNTEICKKRSEEKWGVKRIHRWLCEWDNFSLLDEQVVLCHIVFVLKYNGFNITRNEIRNCFNENYKLSNHGEKRAYINYINNI